MPGERGAGDQLPAEKNLARASAEPMHGYMAIQRGVDASFDCLNSTSPAGKAIGTHPPSHQSWMVKKLQLAETKELAAPARAKAQIL